jgi:hypothetical protein
MFGLELEEKERRMGVRHSAREGSFSEKAVRQLVLLSAELGNSGAVLATCVYSHLARS